MDTAKGSLIAEDGARELLELVKEPRVEHRHLINHQHLAIIPTLQDVLALGDNSLQLVHGLFAEATTGKRVERSAANVAGRDPRRCSHEHVPRAVPFAQRLDDELQRERLAGAGAASEKEGLSREGELDGVALLVVGLVHPRLGTLRHALGVIRIVPLVARASRVCTLGIRLLEQWLPVLEVLRIRRCIEWTRWPHIGRGRVLMCQTRREHPRSLKHSRIMRARDESRRVSCGIAACSSILRADSGELVAQVGADFGLACLAAARVLSQRPRIPPR